MDDTINRSSKVKLARQLFVGPGDFTPEQRLERAIEQAERAKMDIARRQRDIERLRAKLKTTKAPKARERLERQLDRAEQMLSRDVDRLYTRENQIRAAVRGGAPKTLGEVGGVLARALFADLASLFGLSRRDKRVDSRDDIRPELAKQIDDIPEEQRIAAKIVPNGDGSYNIQAVGLDVADLKFEKPVANSPADRLGYGLFQSMKEGNYSEDDNRRLGGVVRSLLRGDFDKARERFDRDVAGRGILLPDYESFFNGRIDELVREPEAGKRQPEMRSLRPSEVAGWEEIDPRDWARGWSRNRLQAAVPRAQIQGRGDLKLVADQLGLVGARPKRVLRKGDLTFVIDDDIDPDVLPGRGGFRGGAGRARWPEGHSLHQLPRGQRRNGRARRLDPWRERHADRPVRGLQGR